MPRIPNYPIIDTPDVRALIPLIDEVYEWNGSGGNLHIIVDDQNIHDDHLEWCGDYIASNPNKCPDGQIAAELACLSAMATMSVLERGSALAIRNGWESIPAQWIHPDMDDEPDEEA